MVMATIHSERYPLGLWVSCTLNVHVLLESWGGLHLLLMSWISHETLVSVRCSVERVRLFLLHVPFQIYHRLQLICHEGQSHLHHRGSDLIHDWRFLDRHHGPIWDALCGELKLNRVEFFPTSGKMMKISRRAACH